MANKTIINTYNFYVIRQEVYFVKETLLDLLCRVIIAHIFEFVFLGEVQD